MSEADLQIEACGAGLASSRVRLHSSRVRRGSQPAVRTRSRRQSAFRPILSDFDDMTTRAQVLDRLIGNATFKNKHAGARETWPERGREMFSMPGGGVDRLLQIMPGMNMAKQKLRRPLILLVATRRSPGEVRFTAAQSKRWRQGGARPLSGLQRSRMFFVQPEHLRARAEAEAKAWNDRR